MKCVKTILFRFPLKVSIAISIVGLLQFACSEGGKATLTVKTHTSRVDCDLVFLYDLIEMQLIRLVDLAAF